LRSVATTSISVLRIRHDQTKTDFPHCLKSKRFKKDTIHISDKFILEKTPEFENVLLGRQLESPRDKFLFINRELRAQNRAVVNELMERSDPEIHWDGTFLRLPKSATRVGFWYRRTYEYRGINIDQQTHLGIDLASVATSPVSAVNSGKPNPATCCVGAAIFSPLLLSPKERSMCVLVLFDVAGS